MTRVSITCIGNSIWYLASTDGTPLFDDDVVVTQLRKYGFHHARDSFTGAYGYVYMGDTPFTVHDSSTVKRLTDILNHNVFGVHT
jgi:hypothetical protein